MNFHATLGGVLFLLVLYALVSAPIRIAITYLKFKFKEHARRHHSGRR